MRPRNVAGVFIFSPRKERNRCTLNPDFQPSLSRAAPQQQTGEIALQFTAVSARISHIMLDISVFIFRAFGGLGAFFAAARLIALCPVHPVPVLLQFSALTLSLQKRSSFFILLSCGQFCQVVEKNNELLK
jgi:hypothetical protein